MAARVAGKGRVRISVEHILPNIANLLIVQGTIQFSLGILAEAGLSYVGLGAQPPTPSWGRMLAESADDDLLRARILRCSRGCPSWHHGAGAEPDGRRAARSCWIRGYGGRAGMSLLDICDLDVAIHGTAILSGVSTCPWRRGGSPASSAKAGRASR